MHRTSACVTVILLVAGFALRADTVTAVSGVFTVDRTAPTIPEAVKPLDGAQVTAPFLRLQASATDATSGVAAYEFELVSTGWQEVGTPYAAFSDNLQEGANTWNVRARDAAGNWSEWASFQCTYAFGGDNDLDGLPDAWELACFGSTDYADGTGDSDHDGISDLLEAEAETNGFEFYVDLQPGWNMVAFPCEPTAESTAALVEAAAGPIWAWNAETLRYHRISETSLPMAREGLWIFANAAAEGIAVNGIPPADDKLQLERGWNLTGSGLPAVLDSMDSIGDILPWIDGGYELQDLENFQFGFLQGYWMYVGESSARTLLPVE